MIKQIWQRVWKVIRWIGRLLLYLVPHGDNWKEIHVSPGRRPEHTLQRYSYLQSKGIRCKLRNLSSPSGRGVVAGMISLRVHHDDIGKAYALLREVKD